MEWIIFEIVAHIYCRPLNDPFLVGQRQRVEKNSWMGNRKTLLGKQSTLRSFLERQLIYQVKFFQILFSFQAIL